MSQVEEDIGCTAGDTQCLCLANKAFITFRP